MADFPRHSPSDPNAISWDEAVGCAHPRQPSLLRFTLRHLLILVALISFAFALLVQVHGQAALVMIMAILVVVFHLLGTAVGSHLKSQANRPHDPNFDLTDSVSNSSPITANGIGTQRSVAEVPAIFCPWYSQNCGKIAWMPRLIVAAMLVGGIAGAVALTMSVGNRSSLPGLLVGTLSAAALSGWFTFVAASFVIIVRGGWRDAQSGYARPKH